MKADAGTTVPFRVSLWKRILESAVFGGRVYKEVFASISTLSKDPEGKEDEFGGTV